MKIKFFENYQLKKIFPLIISISIWFFLFINISCKTAKEKYSAIVTYKIDYGTKALGNNVLTWERCEVYKINKDLGAKDLNKYNGILDHLFMEENAEGLPLITEIEEGNTTLPSYLDQSNNVRLINVKEYKRWVSGNNTGFKRYTIINEALDEVEDYKWFSKRANELKCYQYNYECLDEQFLNNLNASCNYITIIPPALCPTITQSFETSQLLDVNTTNNMYCPYEAQYIFPSLKSNYYNAIDNCDNIEYVYDSKKDKYDDKVGDDRYVYINVVLKSPLNISSNYYVIFHSPYRKIDQTIALKVGMPNKDTLVSCINTSSENRKVLKFVLDGPGDYSVQLHNWDDANNKPAFNGWIETKDFHVNAIDEFSSSTGVSSGNYSSNNRNLSLLPLNIPSMMNISTFSTRAFPAFEGVLKDAFSLNEKKMFANLPIKAEEIKEGIQFYIKGASNSANNHFDINGNIKLYKEDVLTYFENNVLSSPSYKDAYYFALMETFKRIMISVGQTDIQNQSIIFYANGAVLVNKDGSSVNTANPTLGLPGRPNEKASDIPNIALIQQLQGVTGPNHLIEEHRNLSVCGIFKVGLINSTSLTEQNRAVITLVHELGHSWAQPYMVYNWDKDIPGVTDSERHNHYCGGYNKELCVFRYGDNNSISNNYTYHNAYGVIWCEAHRQILLNQLMRKFRLPKN